MADDNKVDKLGFKEWIRGITPGQILMSVIGVLLTFSVWMVQLTLSGYKDAVTTLQNTIDSESQARQDLKESLIKFSGQVDNITGDVAKRFEDHDKRLDNHEERIIYMERKRP